MSEVWTSLRHSVGGPSAAAIPKHITARGGCLTRGGCEQPLGIPSITATCDKAVLLANVHVGGVPRSTDGGVTWQPTLEIDKDVHQVCAHPTRPDVVIAAAAVGLCVSRDSGATWTVEQEGLHASYAARGHVMRAPITFRFHPGWQAVTNAALSMCTLPIVIRPVAAGFCILSCTRKARP